MNEKSYIRACLENLDDIIFIIDYPSLRFSFISPSIESLGYTPAEVYADPGVLNQGVDEAVLASIHERLHAHINQGPLHFEYAMKIRSGEERWYSSSVFLVNRSTEAQMLAGVMRDITKQKHTEIALEKLHSRHEDFYNKAPNGYHSLDENGRLVRVNDTELAWLGYAREELLGENFAKKILTEDSQAVFQMNFPKLLEEGVLKELQLEVVRKDGSVFPCLVNATIFKDERTGKRFTRTILTDISELKGKKAKLRHAQQELQSLNQELLEANKKLDRLNFTKDVLLKVISHDLRNPLVTIKMLSDLLQEKYDELDNETIYKYLNYINETSQQANHILDEMVGMVSLDEKSVRFQFMDTSLVPIIEQALRFNHQRAKEKGVSLYFEDRPDQHQFMAKVDAKWLVRALDNLISNAIKFSEEGGEVKVKCHIAADKVIIQVTDNGIGIPQNILQNLFDRIAVQSRTGTKGEKGTGLGLTIVKQILDMQDGEISVESSEGEGSTFEIRLPRVTT
jgi:PAS domain S-box-containing protein